MAALSGVSPALRAIQLRTFMSLLRVADFEHHRHRRVAGGAAGEQAEAAAAQASSSISSMIERVPIGACGWPQTSEQP
jgi:hypothetical protein